MAKQATWKKILENEQNKSKIDGIFKYIDEQTKDFQMRLALKIDQNTEHLQQSLNLAHHSQIFANSLLAADKSSVNKQITKQMQGLLIGPWKQCMQSFSSDLPPYLIVIDALDEIEGKAGAEFLKELLITIKNGHLKGLKFLVTSRPDPELAELCNSFPPDSVCRLQDVSPEQSNDDIMTYLHSKLSVFQSTSELEELKKKANGLFIYASTAVKYILSGATFGEQHELMRQLLDLPKIIKSSESSDLSEATAPIGALYHQILSEAFKVPKNLIPTRLKILHNILCAEERISTSIAAGLLSDAADKDMKEQADDLVKKLHAVLYVKDDKVFCTII
ncbi:hypothetical protein C0989_001972 [Termitomyces sp. Mn162]|nr:hypothetical protein C0989_001972 [Termitomyces sp. Mn162]